MTDRRRRSPTRVLLALGLAAVATPLHAQVLLEEERARKGDDSYTVLPFAFSTESLDFAFGVGGGSAGHWQPTTRFGAAALGTANQSRAVFAMLYGLRLDDRLFVDVNASAGDYTRLRTYGDVPGNRSIPRAGRHDSSQESFREGPGFDGWIDARFRYTLPIGAGRQDGLQRVSVRDGLLHRADRHALEFPGWVRLELRPVHRSYAFEAQPRDGIQPLPELRLDETALAFSLEHDNTDQPSDPGHGTFQRLTVKQGFDVGNGTQDWTSLEAEAAAYFTLPDVPTLRRSVLALDLWTADTPSWDDDGTGRPPPYDGARLGGFFRMRGYDVHRFHDRAALYGCAELRITPEWNPFEAWRDRRYAVEWIQVAGFVEAGRVAPTWSLDSLTTDLDWSAGVGLRLMTFRSVLRLDAGFSDEGGALWAMVSHPFGAR